MKIFLGIFSLIKKVFYFWTKISLKYDRIIQQGHKETSTSFGASSIALSVIGSLLTIGFFYLGILCFHGLSGSGDEGFIQGVFLIILTFFGIIIFFSMSIVSYVSAALPAFVYAIYQLRLNKKAIGFIALILSIVLDIAAIVGVFLLLANLS